ncbi:M14 family metallopeptidase [Pedobacter metabolipauper]|uniref:Zinc carboxypeptidase n=1 Tax=Pedobacter metabolipauper TaxID=425513 RepID=A0A4R6SV03_9SPHI|nr:M14 family metallopeptidase [Pedobacter metabolipauper]TDQ09600.1 zinc carboxypeptidase [Pedobacter metabolipauper]
MKKFYFFNLFFLLFVCRSFAQGQQDYSTNAILAQRVKALSEKYPQWVKSKSLTQTAGGKEIWMLTIGSGKTETKPAIAVVGGVEGKHLLGVEMAIGFAEKLMSGIATDSIKTLLTQQTYYVFPNMSPDATEQYFAKVKNERSGNAIKTDDDRDGSLDEDDADDLDGNGKITWMRILDPTGKYKLNPDDPRSLLTADAAKAESGTYRLLPEGIDNDKDGTFNEDGAGGVHFNKNSSYNFKAFIPGAGEYAVSEKENRALFDFLFDAFNVYAVVTFGPVNNLSAPVQFNPSGIAKRIITSWYDADAKTNALVSERYNKITKTKDAPKTQAENGDFSQWAYFHYGRLSFSTPGWWVPKTMPDSARKQKKFTNEDPIPNYLRWAEGQGITNTFTPWKAVAHPDFPGQTVEVGGIDPFVLINPPYKMVDAIVAKHTDFLVALADMAPKLDFINLQTEKVSDGLTRVTVKILNGGDLSTYTNVGDRSYFLKKITLKVNTNASQTVVSGRKTQTIESIQGKDFKEFTWLIKGSGKVTLEAGSPTTGSKSISVTL